MNRIELCVESICGQPPKEPLAATFGLAGGTIGRSGQNRLILQDSEQRVARIQAMVRLDDGAFHLANLSEQLHVRVDEQLLVSGQETPLRHGSVVEIGSYTLKARAPDKEAELREALQSRKMADDARLSLKPGKSSHGAWQMNAMPVLPEVFAPDRPGAEVSAPPDDPFADIFASLNAPQRAAVPPESGAAAPAAVIPSDWNALDDIVAPAGARAERAFSPLPADGNPFCAPSEQVRNHANPLAILDPSDISLRGIATKVADESLIAGAPASFAPLGALEAALAPFDDKTTATLLDTTVETDPLKVFDPGLPLKERGTWQGALDHVLEINSAMGLPPPFHPAEAKSHSSAEPSLADLHSPFSPSPLAPVPAADAASGQPAPEKRPARETAAHDEAGNPPATMSPELAQAFLEGAGLGKHALSIDVDPEFMRLLGGLLHTCVRGAIDLLAARSEIKREIRADVTMIMQKGNNPLKFMPTAEGAMIQLIARKIPGFMPAQEAIMDTFDDLRAHQVGLIHGVRAALLEALNRFEPDTVERNAAKLGAPPSIFSTRRKARYWENYCANFSRMRSAAEDELKALSGDVFVEAYEAAVEQLRMRR